MPVFSFLFEQVIEVKYGLVGALALFLIGVGKKTNNATCAGVGGAVLALLVVAGSV